MILVTHIDGEEEELGENYMYDPADEDRALYELNRLRELNKREKNVSARAEHLRNLAQQRKQNKLEDNILWH